MKKIIIILLILLGAYIVKIPKYKELNEIAIIEGMAVSYQDSVYNVYLKEIIPIKTDDGINYKYKYYHEKSDNLEKAYKKIINNTKEKLYIKRCRVLVTNLKDSSIVLFTFNINPKSIYHVNDKVYEKLKSL